MNVLVELSLVVGREDEKAVFEERPPDARVPRLYLSKMLNVFVKLAKCICRE